MKKWYIQLDDNLVIKDIIEYPYSDYIEVEMEENSLPAGINGGWFKLEDGIEGNKVFVEYSELKPITKDEEIESLKEEVRLSKEDMAILNQASSDFMDYIFTVFPEMS